MSTHFLAPSAVYTIRTTSFTDDNLFLFFIHKAVTALSESDKCLLKLSTKSCAKIN
jgi:hypothetical protein